MLDKKYEALLDAHIRQYRKENQFIEFKSNFVQAINLGKYISALSIVQHSIMKITVIYILGWQMRLLK